MVQLKAWTNQMLITTWLMTSAMTFDIRISTNNSTLSTMSLRTSRIPLSLAKCNESPFFHWVATDTDVGIPRVARAGIPATSRFYATIPAVVSPAQTPALQRQEPKRGVMDYVLTSADAVIDLYCLSTNLDRLSIGLDKDRFGP
jgi:hypothetical protein